MADFLILDNEKNNNVDNDNNKNSSSFMHKINDLLYVFQKVKTKDKIQFFRLLSTMINAWLSLVKSVRVLEKQQKSKNFKYILWRFAEELSSWKNLSDCLTMFPNDFSEAEVWMVKSWEKTWQLNTVLLDLAIQTERINSINWKIKSAMIYPAFIILVVIWVICIMMIKVVPELLKIFWDPSSLPQSTQTLMAVSKFFQNYIIHLFLWFFILVISVFFWRRTPDWAYIFDEYFFKVPIFWEMNRKIVLSKFSRMFSWLIWSWLSVIDSLRITSEAVWNEVYKQRILLITEDVWWGIKIWESLDWDKLFPDMMVQMIQVWEETAKLEEVVIKIADYYDEEVDNTISAINKLLEPFIIITLAVVVWWIAISILEPIMNLADTVSSQ